MKKGFRDHKDGRTDQISEREKLSVKDNPFK